MALPPIARFPPLSLRKEIAPPEWEQCLESWTLLGSAYLRQSDSEFESLASEERGLSAFLASFFHEAAPAPKLQDTHFRGPKSAELVRLSFRLTHRLLSHSPPPDALLTWTFLADLCQTLPRNAELAALLHDLWRRAPARLEAVLDPVTKTLTKQLDSAGPAAAAEELGRLAPLLRVSTDAGAFVVTGSDFVDTLAGAYGRVSAGLRTEVVAVAYLGLVALVSGATPNFSLLSDHLYSLRTNAEAAQKREAGAASLLADLVTNTPLLKKAGESAQAKGVGRIATLLQSLKAFKLPSIARPRKQTRRKVEKGKGKATGTDGTMHVHRMSLVTQIQDLFPELGSGFVVKLLAEYHDDVEQATAHYLDGSLPAHLVEADKSEQLPPTAAASDPSAVPDLAPRTTPSPPPVRRNIYDDDVFDRLEMDPSLVHQGRKNASETADNLLAAPADAPAKAAILSALAAFDSDDDERDDTYDADDSGVVAGSLDAATGSPDGDAVSQSEEVLFTTFARDPAAFARDAATRRGTARTQLRRETGLTDEAIEGWAAMLRRDPRRLRRLEARFATFGGQQHELGRTAYRREAGEDADEDADDGAGGGGGGASRGGGRGRGRGRGGRGRGGASSGGRNNVSGPANEKDTQVARQRKEAGKSSRANHNRRDQRAKKMARGGFAG